MSAKRIFDVILALLALSVFSPLFLLSAIAIKCTDFGPVFFWQYRVGQHGRLFRFPKFRSMVTGAEKMQSALSQENHHGNSVTFKMKRDPRITAVGRILRRFSLDELPQLWCVLKGEMSLVGPRPALPQEVARYGERDRSRLQALPGITCIWQVSGRADIPFDQQVELDHLYMRRQGILMDTMLLLMTIPAVLSGRGAY